MGGMYNYYYLSMALNFIGIPMTIIRLQEPYVWAELKQLFGFKKKEKI
jgi:hypothetical protein